jgi:hypothetical protein
MLALVTGLLWNVPPVMMFPVPITVFRWPSGALSFIVIPVN